MSSKLLRMSRAICIAVFNINRVGALYLPGSESYMEKCQAEGLIVESQPIGFNRAVLIVTKGSPLAINADLTINWNAAAQLG